MRVVPATKKLDQINAARYVIQRCRFAKTACHEGIEGLAAWSYEYDEETKDFSKEPLHNWASHHGDAFAYGALVMRERISAVDAKPAFTPKELKGVVVSYPGVNDVSVSDKVPTQMTMDDWWEAHESGSGQERRIN